MLRLAFLVSGGALVGAGVAAMVAQGGLAFATERGIEDSPKCAAAASATISEGKITRTTLVPEGPFMGGVKVPNGPVELVPEHCRVEVELNPSADSTVKVEVWLPTSGWNGRMQGVGNGGFAGNLNHSEVAIAVQRGYAAVTTDTGHSAAQPTSVWATGHPERVIDFGHRAIHIAAVTGKTLIRAYYGRGPDKSYFSSCSNGGRQALMEAQRYPEDYDGIVAGAPAADFTGLFVAGLGWTAKVINQTPIPPDKTAAIGAAVYAQCDGLDGSVDGVIEDPRACRVDAAKLICTGKEDDSCLTAGQARALAKLFGGPRAADGTPVYSPLPPGGEVAKPPSLGWEFWVLGTPQRPANAHNFVTAFMRDIATSDPSWSMDRLDIGRDYPEMSKRLGPILNATDPDLSAFARRGGKLILWHGWADAAIPAGATIRYYEQVREAMGAKRADGVSRLYVVPGMQHCWFGPGPWSFNPTSARSPADPARDMAAAIERWVEKGVAPGTITAVEPVDPVAPVAGAREIKAARTGLLCPYPQRARFIGKGDRRDAKNWSCTGK